MKQKVLKTYKCILCINIMDYLKIHRPLEDRRMYTNELDYGVHGM